jgi:hypothetical protein
MKVGQFDHKVLHHLPLEFDGDCAAHSCNWVGLARFEGSQVGRLDWIVLCPAACTHSNVSRLKMSGTVRTHAGLVWCKRMQCC